jgi:FkbM family methyltransferase
MTFVILYGVRDNRRDVTDICLSKLTNNDIIIIPSGYGNRSLYFTDHLDYTEKNVFIVLNGNETEYSQEHIIELNIKDNTINTKVDDTNNKLDLIHSKLKFNHGSLNDELQEQQMAVRFLRGDEKVLEIGANTGRNSLVIASIVNNDNFVTLECDTGIARQVEENRNMNNFTFKIENSALSKRKLIQRGWFTKPSDILEEGWQWVNTITFDELKLKYPIDFDTLILDCEGAFSYILMDMPEILDNINLVIMENDYINISHKNYVDDMLVENNFKRVYAESGGWGCCYKNFYEVWKKSAL